MEGTLGEQLGVTLEGIINEAFPGDGEERGYMEPELLIGKDDYYSIMQRLYNDVPEPSVRFNFGTRQGGITGSVARKLWRENGLQYLTLKVLLKIYDKLHSVGGGTLAKKKKSKSRRKRK